MTGPEIHYFRLVDRLTVDFMHQMSWSEKKILIDSYIHSKIWVCNSETLIGQSGFFTAQVYLDQ